jgi:lipid A 3-O-deacylase
MRNSGNIRWLKTLPLAVIVLSLGMSTPVKAIGVAVEYARSDDRPHAVERGGIALQWPWASRWNVFESWFLGGYTEASFSYWDGEKRRGGSASLGDFGLTPVLRLERQEPIIGTLPYVEFGVGIHGLTNTRVGDKNLDIPFTFGEYLGGGLRFGDQGRFELGYRFQHLSNAGLGDPNPGINFHIFRLGYYF